MRRRELLAGAAATGVVGLGAAAAVGGWNPLADDDPVPEFELEAIDAPGSDPGTITVPERGSVTFLKVFATWCGVCSSMMDPLGEVHAAVGDEIQFVSVTNEPLGRTTTRANVADWWVDHDGRWTVAHDDDLALTGAVDATSVPYAVVFDEANVPTWADGGYKSADELREPIEAARGE